MNAWLFLHFPHLLLDEQLAQQPADQQQLPQVLLEQQAGREPKVKQANLQALQQGVEVAMDWVMAQALVPELQTRNWVASREHQVLAALAQALYQDCAQIALYPPRGLLLEVKSLQRLYGGLEPLRARIEQRIQHQIPPLRYSLASGYSPLAAKLLAEAEQTLVTTATGPVEQALQQLPLQHSQLPAEQIQRLLDVGMQSLGSVLSHSAGALGQRFGKTMTQYLAQLRGELQQPQHYYRPPAYFYQRIDLLTEVQSWQQLLFPLKRLLQQLENFLQVRQLSTQQLLLKAYHRNHEPTQIEIGFAHPVWQRREIFQLVQLQLERQQLSHPALELSLWVRDLVSRESQKTRLFAAAKGEHQEDTQARAQLVNRLQARLGAQAVKVPQLRADLRPEKAHGLQPWQQIQQPTKPRYRSRLPRRPPWLLTEPEPIQRQQWQLQWGPERLVSGWWDDAPCHRDYYIALDPWQRQGWIFSDQQGWFLHGWFS